MMSLFQLYTDVSRSEKEAKALVPTLLRHEEIRCGYRKEARCAEVIAPTLFRH